MIAFVLAEQPTVVSLYSGIGGLDLGFRRAGFRLLWANDVDEHACATYRTNVGHHIVHGDVLRTPVPRGLDPTVLIGGPPCQGFSRIGRMDPTDRRSAHVLHFLDVAAELSPRAFVMENVKALAIGSRWSLIRRELVERAERLGYRTQTFVLNAADFDVPQARERMFFIGMRDEVPVAPQPVSSQRARTVRRTLEALPSFRSDGNHTACCAKVVPAKRPVMRPNAYDGSLLFNGSGRPLRLDAPAKTLPASMGGNATPIVDQDELERGAEPWVVSYHAHLRAGGDPLRSAPQRMRRITVEEAAALQGLPAHFELVGPRVAKYRQIGNAVPPTLAYHVAVAVRDVLAKQVRAQAARTQLELVA